MNFNKIGKKIKDNKNSIIMGLVLWVIFFIVLVLPLTCNHYAATRNGKLDLEHFLRVYPQAMNPTKAFSYIFSRGLFGKFISNLLITTLVIIIFVAYSIIKAKPKGEYQI